MTVIRIDTEEVNSTSTQFAARRGDLDALVSQAKNLMNALQGQFTGQRAQTIFAEWNGLQPNLQAAIQTMQHASDLLKKAATEFGTVDANR